MLNRLYLNLDLQIKSKVTHQKTKTSKAYRENTDHYNRERGGGKI
jgi:hypothetical protein